MQIEISDKVFDHQKPYLLLEAIIRALKFNHQVTPENWFGAGFLGWIQKCITHLGEPDILELLQFSAEVGIFVTSTRSILVVSEDEKDHAINKFTFEEFYNYFLSGTFVYVENSRADRNFLLSLIFDKNIRTDLERAEKLGALVFENCGGITELSNRINDDASGRRPFLSNRAIAIFDSDATGPKMEDVSAEAKKAVGTCNKNNISYLRLARRAIENYLPHAALVDFAEQATGDRRVRRLQMARAIPKLSRDQQAYIHMKDGLSAEQADTTLYTSLDEKLKKFLGSGFGPDLSTCFSVPSMVTEQRFKNSGLSDEVEQISKFLLEYL